MHGAAWRSPQAAGSGAAVAASAMPFLCALAARVGEHTGVQASAWTTAAL